MHDKCAKGSGKMDIWPGIALLAVVALGALAFALPTIFHDVRRRVSKR